jgi:hypothetical protein
LRRLIAAEKGEESDEIPDEQPPFNHDAHYVIHTWLERRLHGIYPEPGGLLDQDAELMADWDALSLWYIRCEKGVYSAPPISENAPSWQGLMGG